MSHASATKDDSFAAALRGFGPTGIVAIAVITVTGLLSARALPLVALTAWQALSDRARLQPAERVFIQGGTGGVGSFAVQLAKALGAKVTATASEDDEPLVKTLGADRVVVEVAVDIEVW